MLHKLLALAFVAALAGVLATAALAATKSVKVGDNYYVRASGVPTVTINKGDKLKFNYTGDSPHNAVGVGISLGSKCKAVKSSGSCTTPALKKTGTFTVYCQVHGRRDQRMKLRIR